MEKSLGEAPKSEHIFAQMLLLPSASSSGWCACCPKKRHGRAFERGDRKSSKIHSLQTGWTSLLLWGPSVTGSQHALVSTEGNDVWYDVFSTTLWPHGQVFRRRSSEKWGAHEQMGWEKNPIYVLKTTVLVNISCFERRDSLFFFGGIYSRIDRYIYIYI